MIPRLAIATIIFSVFILFILPHLFSSTLPIPDTAAWITHINDKYEFQTQYHYQSPPTEIRGTQDVGQFTYLDKIDFGTNPLTSRFGYTIEISRKELSNFRGELIGHITDRIDKEEKATIKTVDWTIIHYQMFLASKNTPVASAFTKHHGYSFIITANFNDVDRILSTFKFINSDVPSLTPPSSSPSIVQTGCKVGGCSGELCVDASSPDIASICIYNENYACYKYAVCEKQANGKCAWTQSPNYLSCLKNIN